MKIYIRDTYVFKNADWGILPDVEFSSNDAEVLAVGVSEVIDDTFLSKFPKCRYILSPSTAIDHIQTSLPIKVINLIPSKIPHISASAEFAFLLILSLLRKYPFKGLRESLIGNDLQGKTLGVLGFGRIGKKVKEYASAFGALVLEHDNKVHTAWSKEDILSKSDIVLLCVSAEKANENYLSDREFLLMKSGSYFVNVSRGFLVDDSALLKSILSGQIAGAGLDVVDHPEMFEGLPNVIITPHIAGSTVESQKKACDFVISELFNERH